MRGRRLRERRPADHVLRYAPEANLAYRRTWSPGADVRPGTWQGVWRTRMQPATPRSRSVPHASSAQEATGGARAGDAVTARGNLTSQIHEAKELSG